VGEVADALTYIDRTVRLDGNPREVLKSGAALELFPTLAPMESLQVQAGQA
jgi:hypothetical protein